MHLKIRKSAFAKSLMRFSSIISVIFITLKLNPNNNLKQHKIIKMKPTIYASAEVQKIEAVALALVEEQLIAYNNRDIEAFLNPFSEDVKGYNYPDKLSFDGKDEMRKRYAQLFDACPNLHCKTMSRTVFKNTVIDKELVTGMVKDENVIPYFIAIYKITSNKISEVRFMRYLAQ